MHADVKNVTISTITSTTRKYNCKNTEKVNVHAEKIKYRLTI